MEHAYTQENVRGWRYGIQILRTYGIGHLVDKLGDAGRRNTFQVLSYAFRKNKNDYFNFQKKRYTYRKDTYNDTAFNERTVEIPVALDLIRQRIGKGS